jgi:hypothetical protein
MSNRLVWLKFLNCIVAIRCVFGSRPDSLGTGSRSFLRCCENARVKVKGDVAFEVTCNANWNTSQLTQAVMRLRQTSNSQIDQMPKQLRCCHICWKWLLDCTYWHQNIARNLLLWFKQEDTKRAISPFRLFWEATCTNCGSQQLKNGFYMIFWHWYVTSLQCTKNVHVVQSIWEPDASIHFWPSLGKQPLHCELCPFSKHVARLGICMGSFGISACRVYTQQRRVGGALVGFTVDYIRSAFRWCFDPFWKKVMHGAQTKIYNWADLLAEKLFDASWCEGSFENPPLSKDVSMFRWFAGAGLLRALDVWIWDFVQRVSGRSGRSGRSGHQTNDSPTFPNISHSPKSFVAELSQITTILPWLRIIVLDISRGLFQRVQLNILCYFRRLAWKV